MTWHDEKMDCVWGAANLKDLGRISNSRAQDCNLSTTQLSRENELKHSRLILSGRYGRGLRGLGLVRG